MSGHSKWSKIKRKKGATDAKRSKMFSKLLKEVQIAAKMGGPDPSGNPRLRLAIQNARGENVPKDNIERAIKKGGGGEGADFQEVTYEGYGPSGVAIFIECTTDNTNRTVANIRSYFNKFNGNLSKSGSLEFIFDQKSVFTFQIPKIDRDELELELIDAGAEEIEYDEDAITVTASREDFGAIQKKLEELKIEVKSANLQRIPNTTKKLTLAEFQSVMKLIDVIEEDDDVQNLYHNIELTDELVAAI